MSGFSGGFSAASIRSYVKSKKEQAAEEQRMFEAMAKTEREKLHQDFMEREVRPDAMDRIAALVQKMVDAGEKQVMLFQFPSDWLPDSGRAITSHDPNWHEHLDGFARRAYDYFQRELAPRGFQLRAEIQSWPGGMPGDVGFILTWKQAEDAP
jgi:hypothetical protein